MPHLVCITEKRVTLNTIPFFHTPINTALHSVIHFLTVFVIQYFTSSWCHWHLFVCKWIVLHQATDGSTRNCRVLGMLGYECEVDHIHHSSCVSCGKAFTTGKSRVRINSGRCHTQKQQHFRHDCTALTPSPTCCSYIRQHSWSQTWINQHETGVLLCSLDVLVWQCCAKTTLWCWHVEFSKSI